MRNWKRWSSSFAVVLLIGGLQASLSMAQPAEPPSIDVAALVGKQPARLIYDTDMDSDCDDAGALGILHTLADRGEVEIIAVTTSALHPKAGPAADVINTYYGRPNIPIGTARPPAPDYPSRYAGGVADRFPHDLPEGTDAPDAVAVYREILSKQPDGSVTIVTVGDMTNLAKLLVTPAAGDGPDGMTLVKQKVKVWVCMGGNFIGKPAKDDLKLGNNNFTVDKKATYAAITQWPTPIVFAGREMCSVPSGVVAGARLNEVPADHPVRVAYELYFGGQAKDRHVADLAAVIFSVRGLGDLWEAESVGSMDLNEDMTFTWNPAGTRTMAYLLKKFDEKGKPNDDAVEAVINELLLQPRRE